MAENKISYLSKTYDDYRRSILDITSKYYSDVYDNLDDASVGSWIVDILSDVGDTLNYNIDRAYQETSVGSANELRSLLDIARTMGCKIPGKKAAIVEVELSCEIPLNHQGSTSDGDQSQADESYCPYIKRGTLFSTGLQTFELMSDVDFSKQFDDNGLSNRQIIPTRDSNGNIISYTYRKLAIAMAGQSKIFKKIVNRSDIKPFMDVTLEDDDILGVESIIVKKGTNFSSNPTIDEFFVERENYTIFNGEEIERYFEVENLAEQYRYTYEIEESDVKAKDGTTLYTTYNPVWTITDTVEIIENNAIPGDINGDGKLSIGDVTDLIGILLNGAGQGSSSQTLSMSSRDIRCVVRGRWERFKNKFITEYTDKWALKVIFGMGLRNQYGAILDGADDFTQYMMCRMNANDYMGVLPEAGTTMYILYRVGGGAQSNIAKDTLKNIIYLNMNIEGNCEDTENAVKKRRVADSLSVTNTTPSYGGKDEPSEEEIRYLIKYNNASQNRCVTLHDYEARIMQIPAKYGCPFRCGVVEENNKVVIYTLGLDYEGKLKSELAEQVAENIKNYISNYRMINDFVEIRSGKIINLGFEAEIYADKSYDKGDVVRRVIDTIYDYMDIRKHRMGDDIFVGDIEKEISKLDGVQNLVYLKAFNYHGSINGYSNSTISQELVSNTVCDSTIDDEGDGQTDQNEVDLKKSDKMLFTEANSMFEIKYKNKDIKVIVKQRS
jgi:hypothetical protein